jgi:putative ABC transport system ATP-binding protein
MFLSFLLGKVMTALVSINKLQFKYQDKLVLDMPSWSVEEGHHVFLQGPSGSGKSTLLNVLTGFLPDYEGEVQVLGKEVKSLSPKQRDKHRGQHIGVIFQQLNLVPFLSVEDNIKLASYFAKKPISNLTERIEALLTDLQLPISTLNQQASTLSVGQQQRVAIARALINTPELLIADEPTSALDQGARDAFVETLFTMANKSNTTIIMVSHDQTLATHFNHNAQLSNLNKIKTQAIQC